MADTSYRTEEATSMKPKGSCKSMIGSVIDERDQYPPTCEMNTQPSETNAKLAHCITARRPGGEYRASHGFKTIACHCGGHPCRCGTEEAKKHIIKDNVQQ
jgi:hypothetical protein